MKKLLILVLTLSSLTAFSRSGLDSTRMELYRARNMANPKSPIYKPQKAFEIFNRLALQGNPEAMNGLGMLYNQGIGITVNAQLALTWFEKSVKGGYAKAYYNLAMMYKTGMGTNQDLVKAYDVFKKGAALNDPYSIYGEGFMLYKGLGCMQNYVQAVNLFKRGSAKNDLGNMYMLGLCYRNGYGVAVNLDSAKYWLTKSSKLGYWRATDELAAPKPENLNIQELPYIQPSAKGTTNLKSGFKIVKHYLPAGDIDGSYTGYAIKFDWSGKFIIAKEEITLNLKYKHKVLTGEWNETNGLSVALTGKTTDSAVVFNNSSVIKTDHYNQRAPNNLEFKDARLSLTKSHDTVFITGNMRLYSTLHKEPEKPEFIMLIRKGKKYADEHNKDDLNKDDTRSPVSKTDSVHFVAYPNPFSGPLQLRYTLKKACRVNIIISDLLNGKIVYRSNPEQLNEGDHTNSIEFNASPGNYVVTLNYGNKIKSAIVFKQ